MCFFSKMNYALEEERQVDYLALLSNCYFKRSNHDFHAYHHRFKSWLDRFHGVATKYLSNYLGWCRVMDQNRDLTPETLLHYALGDFQHLTVT